ncbi:T9SS type A sorting domain-containing protein [Flavobacterium sp. Sd200]|uniref:GEVED domain-containing protein n=1 Tax=Flavobacterium sp. Sd200 TaxID=2692211 RepID=UPI001369E5C4|nr:GEVED domain-containing protein [Flavobacterium sp. Sd200]MXN92999.1 T9SS type A sorting domain-containing protein [Flavobacterium sp. Sd200]
MSNFYQSITLWAIGLLATVQASAQSEPSRIVPLSLTGFNADVVAEGTGGNANDKTTHSVDAFYVFYSKDFVPSNPHSSSASAVVYGGGLENNGALLSSAVEGLNFQVADYASNNALILRNNVTNEGTLTLTTPKKAEKIYIAAVRGEGGSGAGDNHDVTATVNFADGTSQQVVFQATAWWQDGSAPANTAIAGIGEVSRNSATSGWAPRNEFRGLTNASLFYNELTLDAANFDKEITSIDFVKATTSNAAHTTAILAVSIYEAAPAVTEPVVTGFTYDIIANGIGNATESTGVGMDEQNRRALVSLDFQATAESAVPTRGLPVDGIINSAATPGITYQLADYSGANALYLTPDYVTGSVNDLNSGTLSFTAQNRDKVYILSTATGGGATGLTYNAVVNFSDGTSQQATLQARDWYGGNSYAIQGIGRVNIANNNLEEQSNVANPRLYEDVINLTVENQSKTITGVTFSFDGDQSAEWGNEIRLAILAVTTTVAQPVVEITSVAVTTQNNVPATITSNEGTLQLSAAVNPGNANQAVMWSIVSGSDFASLSNTGLLTAASNGTVTVRATSVADDTKFGEIEVTITGQVQGYCEAYFINGCENLNISNVVTTGAVQNISNATTGCIGNNDTSNGYSNHTSVILKAYRNTAVTFTVNFTGSLTNFTYLSVWIDWNHDYTFSDDEAVYLSTTEEVSGALQFTTTVPENAVIGSTRMRMKAVSGWLGSGACGYNSQGEVEDYTFEILADGPTYCTPTYSGWAVNEPAEPITSVQFGVDESVAGAINNQSATEVSVETPRYEDFSSTVVNVTKGNQYTLRVKANTNGNNTNYITIYFDWNGDGTFSNRTPENEEEQQLLLNQPEKHQHTTAIRNSNGTDDIEMVHTVTIPNDAITGRVRMRIVKNLNAPSNSPCTNPFFPRGQVEDYTLNIQNGIAIEEVTVTTANSVEPVITTEGGTLQLVATVAPTATASQSVTWTVQSGSDFVTVNAGGLVTALSNGTAVVRATSVQDTTKFDEIEVTVAVAGPCDAVEAFRYEFDDFTAFPEQCWASSQGYPMIGLTTDADKSIRLYSFMDPSVDFYVVSPAVSTINGEYVLAFDIESVAANAVGSTLQVGTLAAQDDYTTFAPVGSPIVLSAATSYTSIPVPATEGHQYVAIKFIPTAQHQIVNIDNIEWKLAEDMGNGGFNRSNIKVYPNPSKDNVFIDTASVIKSVNVFSLVGQKVFSGATNRVDLSPYAAGVYMFEVKTDDNQTQLFKVVKQ